MHPKERQQARKVLDLRSIGVNPQALAPPPTGWVRAVRDALGITTRQLAAMIGVSAPTVVDLEASERAGTVQLNTLRRAADSMGCDLVYALVPRSGSLDDVVLARARAVALREMSRVNVTMALEGQAVEPEQLAQAVSELADELRDSRSLWNHDVHTIE